MHFGIGKFCITCRKVIMTTELQYYVAYKESLISINLETFQFDLTGKT